MNSQRFLCNQKADVKCSYQSILVYKSNYCFLSLFQCQYYNAHQIYILSLDYKLMNLNSLIALVYSKKSNFKRGLYIVQLCIESYESKYE